MNYQKIYDSISVKCIELDMIFESCRQAADYVGLGDANTIIKVANGKQKTAGGFHWKYF